MYTHLQRDVSRPPVTLATLARMKADGEKIACLTCYDASFAVLLDAADVDVVLVGRLPRHGDPGPRHHGAGDHGSDGLSLAPPSRAACTGRS